MTPPLCIAALLKNSPGGYFVRTLPKTPGKLCPFSRELGPRTTIMQKNSLMEHQNWVSTRWPVHPSLLSRGVVSPFATLKVLVLLQGVLLFIFTRRK